MRRTARLRHRDLQGWLLKAVKSLSHIKLSSEKRHTPFNRLPHERTKDMDRPQPLRSPSYTQARKASEPHRCGEALARAAERRSFFTKGRMVIGLYVVVTEADLSNLV